MACCKGNWQIMLFLVVCSLLWNLCTCAVIKGVELSGQSDGRDWRNGYVIQRSFGFNLNKFRTQKPFDRSKNRFTTQESLNGNWNRFSAQKSLDGDWNIFSSQKPDDWNWNRFTNQKSFGWNWNKIIAQKTFDSNWNRIITQKDFDWDWNRVTTEDPFDWNWNRFTLNPHIFDRRTVVPNDYDYKPASNDSWVILAIFLPPVIGAIIVIICKCTVCNDDVNTHSSSSRTLHPPPRNIVRAPQNTPLPNTMPTIATLREELFPTAPNRNFQSSTNNSFNTNNVADKPPGYSDVVIADLGAGKNKFKEVIPTVPETPPPKYDEGNIMKY